MYGSQLARVYGESVPSVWARTIAGMDQYHLAAGLRNLLHHGSGTVPTLPQFVKACHQREQEGAAPNHSPERSLPKPEYTEPLHAHAQKCLHAFLWKHPAQVTEDQKLKLVKAKNKLLDTFKLIATEEEVTGTEFRDALFKEWRALV